jgi:hypothetical protein
VEPMGVIGMRKLIRMQPKMEIYMSSNGVGRIIFLSSFYLGFTDIGFATPSGDVD